MQWDAGTAREFGDNIRTLRRAANLSQEALAHLAGITKNQVQLIEAGRGTGRENGPISNPRMKTLFGLASALETSPAALLARLNN
ncbi:helix-turn-helix transcriptional regulator [Actinomycetaceae bacterium L2_0104]